MCSFCGIAMEGGRPGFNETCTGCGRDLHTCKNCRFYSPGARWDCHETIEAPVVDKEARNLCEWYETNPKFFEAGAGDKRGMSAADKARRDLDRLFGG